METQVKEWMMASDGSAYTELSDKDTPGSFAARIYPYSSRAFANHYGKIFESVKVSVGGSRINTTNNQMELAGCCYGLAAFGKLITSLKIDPKGVILHIVVDSQYVYCGFNDHPTSPGQGNWYADWITRGMRTKANKPVLNPELWHFLNSNIEKLEKKGITLQWHWVKGHEATADVRQRINNQVDSACTTQTLALRSARQAEVDLGLAPTYQGEEAWYQFTCTGEATTLMGYPRLNTPKLKFHAKYKDMFLVPEVGNKIITVNTDGVMGIGLALQFKNKYPEGFRFYKGICDKGGYENRRVHVWKCPTSNENYFLAATKNHWRAGSLKDWVLQCAVEIGEMYKKLPVDEQTGICVPPMGCGHGGLVWEDIRTRVIDSMDEIPVLLFE